MRNIQIKNRNWNQVKQGGSACRPSLDLAAISLFRWFSCLVLVCMLIGTAIPLSAQTKKKDQKKPKPKAVQFQSGQPSSQQAWEYWAYNVRTWVVSDGSFETQSVLPQVIDRLGTLSFVADPSSWHVDASQAPSEWNWRFMRFIDDPSPLNYFSPATIEATAARRLRQAEKKAEKDGGNADDILAAMDPAYRPLELEFSQLIDQLEAEFVDKFMIVQIQFKNGQFSTAAREYDMRTRKWGALTRMETGIASRVGTLAYRALANAFMPITRLDKVFDKQNPDTGKTERWARARIRSIGVTKTVVRDENGQWQIADNVSSPVWVRPTDVLLPVIRRVTRDKKFESTRTIEWTFLVIRGQEGTRLECRTQSKDRVPLSGRTGTRIEKLALVIRPPNQPTLITLFARPVGGSKEPDPLAEYEVYSRSPGDPSDKPSEIIGKTDFFGKIEVPPSDQGLRLLFIKSGYRPLAKLPVLPGLHDELQIQLPNDEDRLFAEGVVRGLENQVKDLLAQREVIISQIEKMIERGEVAEASSLYDFYRSLNNAQKMKEKINSEKSKLLIKDESQRPRINFMFDKLIEMVNRFITPQEEARILKLINDARAAQPAQPRGK